jgi:hypothetical protein
VRHCIFRARGRCQNIGISIPRGFHNLRRCPCVTIAGMMLVIVLIDIYRQSIDGFTVNKNATVRTLISMNRHLISPVAQKPDMRRPFPFCKCTRDKSCCRAFRTQFLPGTGALSCGFQSICTRKSRHQPLGLTKKMWRRILFDWL